MSNNKVERSDIDNSLEQWRHQEQSALELIKVAGKLRFDKSIEIVMFREDIYDARPSTVLNHHRLSQSYIGRSLTIDDSLDMAKKIYKMAQLPPAKIDLGMLALKWLEDTQSLEMDEFLRKELENIHKSAPKNGVQRDVILYGFGRIGRLAARRLIDQTGSGDQLRLKAIVIRPKMSDRRQEALKRASLLRSDSIHGDFHGVVDVNEDGSEMIINGNRVQLIYAGGPDEIDYTIYGIHDAIVLDNTGVWRDKEALSKHLRPGVSHVILTAPGKGVPNIVYGVNEDQFDFDNENVLSAASCTTNAIVPALKLLNDELGIKKGHLETIHAYTNDQNLIDNFHKKPRRGRGAPINMVLTSTGAATAVSKVIPELEGVLTGNAVRVPTPNVSMAILNLTFDKPATAESINAILRQASLNGRLVEQIGYSEDSEYVSSKGVGMTSACVVDAPSTLMSADGLSAVIYLWYDNEFGYTCQVIRLAKHVAKVRRYFYN